MSDSSDYPAALDTFSMPTSTDNQDDPPHAELHRKINNAAAAIQAELGINPRGGYATVRARLDDLVTDSDMRDYVDGRQLFFHASGDNSDTTTSEVEVFSTTVDLPAGRLVRIMWWARIEAQGSTGAREGSLRIIDGDGLGGQTIGRADVSGLDSDSNSLASGSVQCLAYIDDTGAGGPQDLTFSVGRTSGAGQVRVEGSAARRWYIEVTDEGPAVT